MSQLICILNPRWLALKTLAVLAVQIKPSRWVCWRFVLTWWKQQRANQVEIYVSQQELLRNCHCFTALTLSGFSGALKSGLNISSIVTVDPTRQTPRGFFSQANNKARTLTATHQLLNKENCFTYPIYMTVWPHSQRVLPLLPPFGIFVVLFCTYRDTFL